MNFEKYDVKVHGQPVKTGGRASNPIYDELAKTITKAPQVINFDEEPKKSFRTSISQSMKARGITVSIQTLTPTRYLVSQKVAETAAVS